MKTDKSDDDKSLDEFKKLDDCTRVSKLVDGLFDERLSKETKVKLREWFQNTDKLDLKLDALEKHFNHLQEKVVPDETDYKNLEKIKSQLRIDTSLDSKETIAKREQYLAKQEIRKVRFEKQQAKFNRKSILYYTRIAIGLAAVIIPLLLVGIRLWLGRSDVKGIDVNPLFVNTTIAAEANDIKKLTLPDGSEVWLNSLGVIAYNDDFSKERLVTVEGEAYFSMVKDVDKPFVVKAKEFAVQVLGTEFNIRTNVNESEGEVVLVKGAVEVASTTGEKRSLNPGERLTIDNHTGAMVIEQLSDEEVMPNWRKPRFSFENILLKDVLQELSNYFEKEIIVEKGLLNDALINLDFEQEMTLEQIMDVLQTIGGFNYKIEENLIIIIPK